MPCGDEAYANATGSADIKGVVVRTDAEEASAAKRKYISFALFRRGCLSCGRKDDVLEHLLLSASIKFGGRKIC
jgi:hypothetical protein